MNQPHWGVFGVVVVVLVLGLVWLAHLSERALTRSTDPLGGDIRNRALDGADRQIRAVSPLVLYGNVVVSHGVFGGVVLGAAWYARIPWASLGGTGVSSTSVLIGGGLGVVLTLLNEGAKRVMSDAGFTHSELLRELLTPSTTTEWIVLTGVVLPVIAVAEELLFRGALIGAMGTGFAVSPWVLVVVSSILFGLGHGLQGPGGIVVTGTLGGVLAVAFVLSNSLLVVGIAHYVVNLAEFVRAGTHHAPTNGI